MPRLAFCALAALATSLLALGVQAMESRPDDAPFDMLAAAEPTPAPPEAQGPASAGFASWTELLASFRAPRFGVHVGSHHWPDRRTPTSPKYNNVNLGMNLRFENGATAGFYFNSERHLSTYGGWTLTNSACGPALTIGGITGYHQGPLLPMAIPSVCFLDHLRVMFIPKAEPKGANVLHLALEY
ncbi:hypothetical protein [Ramlibacter agri]|nr:hypothetical protein [Ramlibacter agri]